MERPRRRRVLKTGFAGAVGSFAGCTTSDPAEEGGDGTNARRESTDEPTTATTTEDSGATVVNATVPDGPTQLGTGAAVELELAGESDAETATLRVDANGEPVLTSVDRGKAAESHTISLGSDESTTASINVWFESPGERRLTVNGTEVGTMTVEDNWLQLQYDGSHTGRPAAMTAPTDEARAAWRGGMASFSFGFSPVVVGSRAFVNVGHPGLRRTFDEQDMGGLLVYDLETQNDHHLDRPGMVMNSPAVCQGIVVAATYDGSLQADPAETDGALVGHDLRNLKGWAQTLDTGVVGGVATDGRSVYVSTYSGVVTAHDPQTGSERWRYDCGTVVTTTAAVADGTVYVGDNDGTVHALSAADGSVQWSTSIPNAVDSAPTVVGDALYVPSHDPHDKSEPGGRLTSLSVADGERQWEQRTDEWMGTSVVTDGESLFAGVGRSLWAFDRADGAVQWKGPKATGARFETEGEPLVLDGRVYAVLGHDEGTVFALDAADGSVQWRYNNGVTITSLAVADGDLLVGSQGEDGWATSVNKVVALREPSGDQTGTTAETTE